MQMKQSVLVVLLALVAGPTSAFAGAGVAKSKNPAVTQVVMLLNELEAKIELDGEIEQKSYDKYACWCEDTLARKAKDIAKAKELIKELAELIVKLKAEIAAHAAEIEQLKRDIKGNLDAQREATEARTAEFNKYSKERTEAEQCIGALEAAIKVLTGAGTKTGFLETPQLQEAKLLSIVAGVRGVLDRPRAAQKLSDLDLKAMKEFVDKPENFVSGRSSILTAAQIANNPFGDYAPQSTQIQGILKGMYDSFAYDLEKDNAEESDAQKAYEAFMTTKKQELATLELTLETQTADKAAKTQKLAESQTLLDDTKAQLKADEIFFAETKKACEAKAAEWSERVRLRTEELQGVGKAIQVLSDPEATEIFKNSSSTFVQLSSVREHTVTVEGAPAKKARSAAFEQLKSLATTYKNSKIARIAAELKAGGHFDKMLKIIDDMIALLRREEQEDIAHRDRCQGAIGKNANDKEDAEAGITKADNAITRLGDDKTATQTKIDDLEDDIEDTEKELKDILAMRNKEKAEFTTALEDDAQAVALLEEAMVWLTKFYKDNKIPLALVAKRAGAPSPAYTVDPDKAPDVVWDDKSYKGKTQETVGLVAIIGMIKEDVEMEMKVARKEEAEAQKDYEKQRASLQEVLDADIEAKITVEKELAEVNGQISDEEETKGQKEADKRAEIALKTAIDKDCDWVNTHFDSRRTARKKEINGLQEAKAYLAGVEEDPLAVPPSSTSR